MRASASILPVGVAAKSPAEIGLAPIGLAVVRQLTKTPNWLNGFAPVRSSCGAAKPDAHEIGDAEGVLELLWLLLTTVLAWVRPRHDLVVRHIVMSWIPAIGRRGGKKPLGQRLT